MDFKLRQPEKVLSINDDDLGTLIGFCIDSIVVESNGKEDSAKIILKKDGVCFKITVNPVSLLMRIELMKKSKSYAKHTKETTSKKLHS